MGALKVNGDIISTSTIKVDNSNSSGYVKLSEDGEGGTIQVVGKNATYAWEMDSYNNKDFRIFTNGSGSYKFFTFSGDTGNLTASNFIGNTNGYTWDLATHNTADTWLFVLNGSKIQHRLATDFCAASGSNNYVKVYNSNNVGGSSSVTMNDLAKSGFAAGMIHSATDNPTGSAKWVHGLSMAWGTGSNTDWISQLAFGVQDSNGLWYRTNQSACVGKPWKRVLDSSNYNSYSPTLTGGGASGTWGINISGNASTAGTANYSKSTKGIENYHITTNGGNAGLWTRAIAATLATWKNYRQVIAVSSRHQGNGIFIISFSTHGTTDSYDYDCRYYGSMNQAYINNWVRCYYNPSTGYFSMWVQDGDYSDCNFRILHDGLNSGLIENDTPVSAIPSGAGNLITIKVNAGDTCYNFGANQPSGSAQIGTLYYQTIG